MKKQPCPWVHGNCPYRGYIKNPTPIARKIHDWKARAIKWEYAARVLIIFQFVHIVFHILLIRRLP